MISFYVNLPFLFSQGKKSIETIYELQFYILLSVDWGKQEEPINGACYITLDVPAVQNNIHTLKIQF